MWVLLPFDVAIRWESKWNSNFPYFVKTQQLGAESRSSGRSSDSNAQAVSATDTSDELLPKEYQYQQALLTGATLDRHHDAMKLLMVKNHRKCRVYGMYGLGKDRSTADKSASSFSTRHQLSKHSVSNSRAGNRSIKNATLNRLNDKADDVVPLKRSAILAASAMETNGPIEANTNNSCHIEQRRVRKPDIEMWPPFSGNLSRTRQTNESNGRTTTNVVYYFIFCLLWQYYPYFNSLSALRVVFMYVGSISSEQYLSIKSHFSICPPILDGFNYCLNRSKAATTRKAKSPARASIRASSRHKCAPTIHRMVVSRQR